MQIGLSGVMDTDPAKDDMLLGENGFDGIGTETSQMIDPPTFLHTSIMSMAARLRYFINSPTGPKTTHFWGPVANWGFVLAAMADMRKPADVISINMTSALSIYSLIFMRFAWMVKPRNYLLLACHASNETAQLYQLQRGVRYQTSKKAAEKQA
ncbi:pyruvate transporter mpc1 [Phytophthora ramorum]|nr:Mitochondrial pyruvate carrier 1 [Phytophthora ramorum]